jgi:hypothetical protein
VNTLAEIHAALTEVTWFPGTSFGLADTAEGPTLTIYATWPDADEPDGNPLKLRIVSHVPPFSSQREFYAWLDWRLCRIAVHEHGEWFRINGQRYRDPGHAR